MFQTIYENRDELIARIHYEASLTGLAKAVHCLKTAFTSYVLTESRDERIARLHYEQTHPDPKPARPSETEPPKNWLLDPNEASRPGNAFSSDAYFHTSPSAWDDH